MCDDFTAQELPPSRFAIANVLWKISFNEQLSLMREKRSEKAKS
jgi:hypothetical protein